MKLRWLILICLLLILAVLVGAAGQSVPMGASPHSLYTAPPSVGKWLINEGGAATTLLDSSGSGNNAPLTGGQWCSGSYYTTGYVLTYSGCFVAVRNVYATVGNITALNFDRTNPFTITAWINTTGSSAETIVSKFDYGVSGAGYCVRLLGSTIALDLQNTGGGFIRKSTAASVNTGAWFFVAISYSGSSTAAGVNMYVNGALSNGAVGSDTLSSGTTQSTAPFLIGAFTTGVQQPWDGNIEDVRVMNSALSGAQISAMYSAGPGA